jgi:Ca2+-binding EF-hand superfamily protein
MPLRPLYAMAIVPVVAMGLAVGAYAQSDPAPLEQPVAARDKALVESAFTKADANGDGRITRDEAAKLPSIGTKFDALDKDKDGVLSLEEFATGLIAPD